MAEITAALVKELRERTGAGMMDCKAALQETNGDMEAAGDSLRKKGLAKAAKKAEVRSRRPACLPLALFFSSLAVFLCAFASLREILL